MSKLLYITNGINGPGGLERVLSIKASLLADTFNYEVHILTLNGANLELFYTFSPKIILHSIEVSGNPISYFLKYKKGIKSIIKKIKPNLISVCDDGLKGLLFPIIFGKKIPVIYERHVSKNIQINNINDSLLSKVKTNITFKLMDWGAKKFHKFVVLTNGNLHEWDADNLTVIPNPLSFYPEVSSNLMNTKVIAVGKHSYQKGYDRLLKSWKKISQTHKNWNLEIYGTINASEGLEELRQSLNISDSVHFFPPTKKIGDKYQEASIFVMSSRYEGFGMVLTEAMAYGVPCVSFDCPYGPSDIITHENDGILVDNGNIDAMTKAIERLIVNKEERFKFGENAKESVLKYLPDTIVQQWDKLFKSLIEA